MRRWEGKKNLIFKKYNVEVQTGFSRLRAGSGCGLF